MRLNCFQILTPDSHSFLQLDALRGKDGIDRPYRYKAIASEHFAATIQEPSTLAESNLVWNSRAWSLLPSMLSGSMLGNLAVPILRHLSHMTRTDVMKMWDPNIWLSKPHLVQPEEIAVLPEEISRSFK